MSGYSRKRYLDKAVQTGLPPSSHTKNGVDAGSQNDSSYEQSVLEHVLYPADLSSAIKYLSGFDAYMHSGTAETRSDIPNSPHRFRRVQRYAQIQHNQPSQVISPSRRIVSLPETSPPYRIYQVQENAIRIVSMPERLKHSNAANDSSEGSLIEHLQQLSDSYSTEGISEVYDTALELPRTPSPPSSDSIVIIENDQQVPRTFLGRKYRSNLGSNENEGCVFSQRSPPKPIPALHGPLSLPYARCPSGAEGTIIEGEDLSHVVWGLNRDTSRPANPKNIPLSSSDGGNAFRKAMPSISQDSFARPRAAFGEDVIDLSRPGTLYAPSTSRVTGQHVSLGSVENPILVHRAKVNEVDTNPIECGRGELPVHFYSSQDSRKSGELAWNTGLGINILPSLQDTDVSRSVEPSFPLQRRGNGIAIQTPSASSTQWTPQFCPTYSVPFTPEVKEIPHITIASLDQDFVGIERLRYPWTITPDLPTRRPEPGSSPFIPLVNASCLPISTNDAFCSGRGVNPNINKGLSSQLETDYRFGNPLVLAPPISTNTRPDLSYQQPRSIPLTRLIQRKLTSVAEEVEPRDIPSGVSMAGLSLQHNTGRPPMWVPSSTESKAISFQSRATVSSYSNYDNEKELNPPGARRDVRNPNDTRAQSVRGAETKLGRNKENDVVQNTAVKPNKFYRKKHVKLSHVL